eukprot:CAMPEP_0170553490 /NCGR_PEP_ID=MMETSP0211-20121228/11321_1 /TAXON_ID=311385 /ORGANISM="Pseudokeronopsis sp., Strain OXSARD2" /LENGTH=43 /DNA_ID= /DNA_START= /DNA_END= /DNA_ORIENTATION=
MDLRKMTHLHCMRKFFEEGRSAGIHDMNGDELFSDQIRNFDGS